ncbi:LLM class flavin-dependent oxidoreductase [Rhizobium pusense]|uniref:LLM class flavin-dependent oxidoreductase n=1 Tax=Agrobacterium pusense TaxID=648995 RepID=A0A6H0ZII4_9HYPH|nr:LLM class flavin-dependent oxidoreductase [Agrobacterium pusense]MDH2092346.1 LLM class flavin-dependent oxidoreductase [Agrobacterium pusense]QIX19847.1 LLM class flavin-dependent oxidoreductase [Agrobacterium pusense]WCK27629.1 LLM class flavin-dependent oxidoreductase [Agrobacterium pusense]
MDLGLFMMPLHDQRRNFTELLKQDREAVILADRLGFSEVWVGEHITCACEPIADPLQFFGSLIHATKQIKFATGVLNLPQHHPARLAGQIAQFDHLSEGRFIMGVGPGGLVTDMELFGTSEKNRAEMTTESIKIMHQIWSQDAPYNIKGKYWDVVVEKTLIPSLGFGPMLKPYQQPFPELAISVMSPSSSSARQAGENGWSIVSANFTPVANVKTHWEQYVIGSEKAGLRPDRNKWRIARSLLVTDSDQEAADYLAEDTSSYRWYYEYIVEDMKAFKLLGVLKPSMNTLDSDITVQNCLDWMVLSGSPKKVLDKLVAFVDEVGGPFGSLMMTQKDWDRPSVHKRSMELLSTEVMPKLRQHVGTLAAAE